MGYIDKEGPHEVKIVEAEFGRKNNDKQTPYLYLQGEDSRGDTTSAYLWLSEAAFAITDKNLKEVFGFDGNYETAVAQVMGKECQFVIELEANEKDPMAKRWPKVRFINKPGAKGGATHHKIENQTDFLTSLTRMSKAAGAPAAAAKEEVPDFLK